MADFAILDGVENVKPLDEEARPLVRKSRYNTELGWKDPIDQAGRWRSMYYPVREKNPAYYDPIITNSMIGPGGLEQGKTKNMMYRDMPSKLSDKEWRDRRYFLDPNVKAIYEKYPIARQHPGLGFRPTGTEKFLEQKAYIGNNFFSLGLIRDWPGIMPQHWKFFAAPFGEDCHVKTAVMARNGLLAGTAYFIFHVHIMYMGRSWRYWLQKLYHYNSYTVPTAAAWAAASCISCSLRGKDDTKNLYAGGAAVGAMIGLKRGFFYGFRAGLAATILSCLWYYAIAHEEGFGITKSIESLHQDTIFPWDPAGYKWAQFETNKYEKQPWNF